MARRDFQAAQLAVDYAQRFIGTPYRWGGDDPMAGFNCSGLANEVLQAVGYQAHGMDYTADGLWRIFQHLEVPHPEPGCLVLWLKNDKAVHVEIAIDGTYAVGASGGGSGTGTIQDAINQNAFIKIRPMSYRGPVGRRFVDPFKGEG